MLIFNIPTIKYSFPFYDSLNKPTVNTDTPQIHIIYFTQVQEPRLVSTLLLLILEPSHNLFQSLKLDFDKIVGQGCSADVDFGRGGGWWNVDSSLADRGEQGRQSPRSILENAPVEFF